MTSGSLITETIFISDPPAARIGWGAHTQASAFDLLDDVAGERLAGQIARQALGALEVVRRDGLLAVNGEA